MVGWGPVFIAVGPQYGVRRARALVNELVCWPAAGKLHVVNVVMS